MVEEDGTTTTKYVYGNELISAKTYEKSLEELKQEGEKNKQSGNQQADITYYYHYDNLKSTTLLTDETGEVVETYDYGTYGEVTSGDTTLTRFLYNGGLGVSSDSNALYYMRARYYNPAIKRFINQDVETGNMDNSASLNRYAYVQGNPVSLTDSFGLSPDMEYGNYEANALKRLFKVADKVADVLPVVGTARDIKRSYNAFKNGNIADGIKHGATAALALAGPAAKVMKSAMKLVKNSLKAEKCLSKIAQIASEGIKLAGKAVRRVGDAGKKVAKTVKNGVSTVARTVKRELIRVYKDQRGIAGFGVDIKFGKKKKTQVDLYSFGNAIKPRGARPQKDFGVENLDSKVGPEFPPLPKGASNFTDINNAPLSGHYYILEAGTEMPNGLGIIADGCDVISSSSHGVGHYTIYPTREMTVGEFNELYQSLPWKYGGKKK